VHEHRDRFEVALMCEILNVSRQGYYAWRRRRDRGPSPREVRRAELTAKIRVAHEQSRRTYGSPRVTVELKAAGERTCVNTVAKYMRAERIRVTPRRRFVPRTTDPDHPHPIAANVLDRSFAAAAPDRKWAADVTYVPTTCGPAPRPRSRGRAGWGRPGGRGPRRSSARGTCGPRTTGCPGPA